MEATLTFDGDRDLLELDPLELERELELDEDREPDADPLELEPESLERDFRRFFLVLCEGRVGGGSTQEECPFTGLPRSNLSLLYWSALTPLSFHP